MGAQMLGVQPQLTSEVNWIHVLAYCTEQRMSGTNKAEHRLIKLKTNFRRTWKHPKEKYLPITARGKHLQQMADTSSFIGQLGARPGKPVEGSGLQLCSAQPPPALTPPSSTTSRNTAAVSRRCNSSGISISCFFTQTSRPVFAHALFLTLSYFGGWSFQSVLFCVPSALPETPKISVRGAVSWNNPLRARQGTPSRNLEFGTVGWQ